MQLQGKVAMRRIPREMALASGLFLSAWEG